MPVMTRPGRHFLGTAVVYLRSFRLGSRQAQFRWEVFNVFNTMTPNNPVSALSNSDFGKITSLAAGTAPRIMQFGMKYLF